MSVQRASTIASRPVPILLALSLVAVILATGLLWTVTTAMVSHYFLKLENYPYGIVRLLLHTYIDIDECAEGTHNCAQRCSNTIGSFTCDCDTGYGLASDGYSCNGNHHTIFSLMI